MYMKIMNIMQRVRWIRYQFCLLKIQNTNKQTKEKHDDENNEPIAEDEMDIPEKIDSHCPVLTLGVESEEVQ